MIGVIADESERDVVREFFELFKTPWEFCQKGRCYDVLLSAREGFELSDVQGAKLVVVYAGRSTAFDCDWNVETGLHQKPNALSYGNHSIPLYGDARTFSAEGNGWPVDARTRQSAVYIRQVGATRVARVGYDLFREIRTLLTIGQPAENAERPALELHIDVLRTLVTVHGLPLVEVPPVPDGYPFIACMTHDVDHPSIRLHKWDHTALGFLYRGVIGSLVDFVRNHVGIRTLLANWAAAAKLPFVYLGIAKDFWLDFPQRYLSLEEGARSTFFFIPFRGRPGRDRDGMAPKFRAAAYGAADVADTVRKLTDAGCEVGLHGIDAWMDATSGRDEIAEIRRLTQSSEVGVRMHWLYYDQQSATALERAGAAYDSTIGYNQTVGYRAGTMQVYKPLAASQLLELPLHAMDTALFYRDHLGLSARDATGRLRKLVENAVRFGGCLTANWHDRSLAPERQWGDCYRDLISELRTSGAWFATAGEAVGWFRMRRSVVFEQSDSDPDTLFARVSGDCNHLPPLRLRLHNMRQPGDTPSSVRSGYTDLPLHRGVNVASAWVTSLSAWPENTGN